MQCQGLLDSLIDECTLAELKHRDGDYKVLDQDIFSSMLQLLV